jgi:hypothetical protein
MACIPARCIQPPAGAWTFVRCSARRAKRTARADAFADGSDWAKVIPLLQAQGLRVTPRLT